MWYWDGNAGWWMLFGGIWMVVFWGVIIGLIVWGIKKLTGRDGTPSGPDRSLEILKERYAKGELTREQFEQMKKDLS